MTEDVTIWLDRFLTGDQDAAQLLWDRYFAAMFRLASRKLGDQPRRAFDEEDVALSAFQSFCRAAQAGRFPDLRGRDELWQLLVTITRRKVTAVLRRQYAQKRGAGQVQGESIFAARSVGESFSENPGMAVVPDGHPSPEVQVLIAEECQLLLDALPDETLRQLAICKLEGFTNEEIGRLEGCSLATVERKLARIRQIWRGLDKSPAE